MTAFADRETSRTSSQPVRSRTMSLPIVISANRTSATIAKTTPGPGELHPAQAAIEGDAGQDHADRRDRRPERLERRQRFAAEQHRQHDREPAVRRDHPADDRDRADPQPGEIGEVGAGPGQADERAADEDGRVGRERDVRSTGRGARSAPRPTTCIPVVTDRLPTRRLASAEKMSSVPHARAAPSPVRRPMGIAGA